MEDPEHDLIIPPVREENICLPLSINAVSQYWNVNLPIKESLEIAKKYPNINGTILIEGIELAERHELGSLIIHSSLSELKKIIDFGIPPIVILPGVQNTVQHASIISGYDQKENTIMHHIPEQNVEGEFQVGVIPETKFDRMWSEDARLMIILAPPDIISKLDLENNAKTKSNRLCFQSEKLSLLGKKDKAIEYLKEAISLDGKNSTAFSLLGGVFNEQNSSQCIQYYEKSIALNNRCYLAYRGLGNYYLKTKEYEKAERSYSKAIGINPFRFGPIYKNRGLVRLEQNKKNEAKEDFKNYLKYTPSAKDREEIEKALLEL